MTTDLSQHIQQIAVVDTHEHLRKEDQWVGQGPEDVLADLFCHYELNDLVSAGAPVAAMHAIGNVVNGSIESRFNAIQHAWQAMQWTSYGEAVRLHAQEIYGIYELTPQNLQASQNKLDQLRQPGQRLRLLRETANLDHIQVDDGDWRCVPDLSGPDFFLYDLSWVSFCSGYIAEVLETLMEDVGIEVSNLVTLRSAMEAVFAKHGPHAIAVKSQHAYLRTLKWVERNDADAERALQTLLARSTEDDEEARLCMGDWCWARGCELAQRYNLPFKIHTGYLAGNNSMVIDQINPRHLCPLLAKYPNTRFVLMHTGYPYQQELLAIAKHFQNVWVDMCWAWSIDSYSSMDFVRRFLRTVPINKLFAFGGDTLWPTGVYRYALQMRNWVTKTFEAEVTEGNLSESQAMMIASHILHDNQYSCFDVDGRRLAIKQFLLQGKTTHV